MDDLRIPMPELTADELALLPAIIAAGLDDLGFGSED